MATKPKYTPRTQTQAQSTVRVTSSANKKKLPDSSNYQKTVYIKHRVLRKLPIRTRIDA